MNEHFLNVGNVSKEAGSLDFNGACKAVRIQDEPLVLELAPRDLWDIFLFVFSLRVIFGAFLVQGECLDYLLETSVDESRAFDSYEIIALIVIIFIFRVWSVISRKIEHCGNFA